MEEATIAQPLTNESSIKAISTLATLGLAIVILRDGSINIKAVLTHNLKDNAIKLIPLALLFQTCHPLTQDIKMLMPLMVIMVLRGILFLWLITIPFLLPFSPRRPWRKCISNFSLELHFHLYLNLLASLKIDLLL
ncbi:hypothetical protein DSO57_1009453 [Entomophthora muscae]|uniref:Uncharacterized protein n=1 Tax=Entomophthora muscae TaxID=34485 RepID=A0ACC2THY1_9FUNG|nr:hypothetical protein DSO57_1009453 [Entomophthora muscae]